LEMPRGVEKRPEIERHSLYYPHHIQSSETATNRCRSDAAHFITKPPDFELLKEELMFVIQTDWSQRELA